MAADKKEWKWQTEAEECVIDSDKITMTAGHGTNLFNSPSGYFKCGTFPYLYVEYQGDFIVICKVLPEFHEVYDLGSIVVWDNEDTWIKLAYENTDNGYPAIVSVVTREYSDDCNGAEMDGPVWLQISRKGDVFALHFSKDRVAWQLARICRVSMSEKVKVGISAQCPSGEQCKVCFEDFEILENTYSNQRKAE